MKELLTALCAILAVSTARPNQPVTIEIQSPTLFGSKVCTWGPGYWCQNITTSAGCHATTHCIKHKWEQMEVPEDNDSVCKICKDMVQQARDQLESNETQEDLKAVFRGSCALIHIKTIVKECDKLVDDFVPELVETLASQMNPSVVCSVAGLCNSARIDKLLEQYENVEPELQPIVPLKNDEYIPNECSKCYTIMTHMEMKSKNTSNDEFLKRLISFCGLMSSFSDACSSIVLTYFDTIRDRFNNEFNADNICHLSGKCSEKFHVHEENDKSLNVEIRPLSSVGMVEVSDDLPCKLCEQLVSHLRDLLVANTTEAEFQQVLEGLCKQTKSFSSECISIVDEYYPVIYNYLVNELDGNLICEMGGICPAQSDHDAPLSPLVSQSALRVGLRIMDSELTEEEKPLQNPETSDMQLPIERMYPSLLAAPQMNYEGQKSCAFCEYLLHYIQEVITSPTSIDEVKTIVDKVCTKLPNSIKGNCMQFIDDYGSALVAILATEIDPSVICPQLGVCPTKSLLDLLDIIPKEYTIESEIEDKPTCPLCLLAVQEIYDAVRNNKTEENIETELDKLCSHLPKSLSNSCIDLVKGYSKELIEKLLDDMKPEEVCISIKLCNKSKDVGPPNLDIFDKEEEIMTNEIPDYNPNESEIEQFEPLKDIECSLCKVVMKYLENELDDKKTQDEIENIVHGICNHIPSKWSKKCNSFVIKYGDLIIQLLSTNITPREICVMIDMCSVNDEVKDSVTECAVCRVTTSEVDRFLNISINEKDLKELLIKTCKFVPASAYEKCHKMILSYGQSMINIIKRDGVVDKICSEIALCSEKDYLMMRTKGRIRRETLEHCKNLKMKGEMTVSEDASKS